MGFGDSVDWGADIGVDSGVGSDDRIKFVIDDRHKLSSSDSFFDGLNDGQTCGFIEIWFIWI